MIKLEEKVKIIYDALDDKKGEDIKVLDISKVSIMADYLIIAGGSNKNQVQAMVESVQDMLRKEQIHADHVEGYNTAQWILLDYQDVIVHIFDQEQREFYNLEKIWHDAVIVNMD